MARLGNYIEQIRGVSYKPEDVCASTDVDAVAILRANNIQDDGLIFDDLVYVKKDKVSAKQYIQKGDIVVCASSGSKNLVGKAAIVNEDMEISFGAFCKVIRPKKLMPSYIGHYFQSPKYRNKISELAGGANINNIRNEHIDDLDIVVPNTDEQDRISIELNKVGGLISLRKQQLSKLDELVKSQFIEMFGDPIINPRSLQVKKLSELATLITKGASPTWQGYNYTDDSTQTLFVTSENVREGSLDLNEPKYLEDGFNDKQARSVLKKGDFLINIVGASIGRAARFDLDVKANINQAVALVRMTDEVVTSEYMMYYLNSPKALEMYDAMKSAVARANLSLQNIGDLEILIPSKDEQITFSAFLKQSDKSKFEIQKSLEKLGTLKKALMQKYFG